MGTSAEDVARVIESNSFAKPREIREAQEWGERYHPTKDLAELLFMRGVIDRGKVGLIRKMAKMTRGGSSRRPATKEPPPPPEEKGAGESTKVSVRDLTKVPDRIGKYEILEKIAQGGMGMIFKARHTDLDREFAVKLLTPRAEASEEATARFNREAKTAARLDHRNIVRVYDAGVQDGAPYLVMDFVAGPNLAQLIKEEGLGIRKAAQIARSIALALQHAHDNGVVHRDVKPDNIILHSESGEPKITDFGIVKELSGENDDSKLTQTGFTLGSPCYMSPEQAEGRHDLVGTRSDVYSLGATLYEMLAEEPPHDGESIHEIMTKVVGEDPLPVRTLNPSVPRDLEVVTMKALEKDLDRRYATARELAEDLGRFLSEEPVLAKPAGLSTKLWRVIRRHRAVSVLVAVFALAALGGLGAAWRWQHGLKLDAIAAREDRIDRAELSLRTAAAAEDSRTREHAYYEALTVLEGVLREDPKNERALDGKRRAVLALGDHLIETGDARFAEFVFTLGAGVADPAEINSRIETARLGIWVEKAEQAELEGDRDAAIEFYQKGLRSLQEAGYGGARLQARIDDLQDEVRQEQLREEIIKIVRLAEASAAQDDHVAALEAYKRAQALDPDDRDLASRVDYHHQKASDSAARLRRRAVGERARAIGVVQGLGAALGSHRAAVERKISDGDAALARAEQALSEDGFPAAGEALRAAQATYVAAYQHANAVRARTQAQQESKEADARQAGRFAPTQLGAAKDLQFRAEQAFEGGDYFDASDLYTKAGAAFRRAARAGSGKSEVAGAREKAQSARAAAVGALNKSQRTNMFELAEADFQRAERHYDAREYTQARDLYRTAQGRFDALLAQAPTIIEATGLRARVREMRNSANRELAREFATDDYSRARQAELTGDQSMGNDDPRGAIRAYNDAIYRYKRSISKSKPHAEAKREFDALMLQVNDARQYCIDEKVEWKPNFKRAEDRLREAEGARQRTYWNGALRHLERALKLYRSLHK